MSRRMASTALVCGTGARLTQCTHKRRQETESGARRTSARAQLGPMTHRRAAARSKKRAGRSCTTTRRQREPSATKRARPAKRAKQSATSRGWRPPRSQVQLPAALSRIAVTPPSLPTALLVLWNADATPRWNDETEPQSTSDRRQRTALRVQPALPLLACFFTEAFEPLYIVSELTYVSLMSLLNTATRCCCVVTVPRMRDQTRYTNSCTPYLCRTGCLRIAIDLPRFVNAHQRSFTRSSFFPSPLGLRQPRPRLERRRWVQSIYTRMRREKFRL